MISDVCAPPRYVEDIAADQSLGVRSTAGREGVVGSEVTVSDGQMVAVGINVCDPLALRAQRHLQLRARVPADENDHGQFTTGCSLLDAVSIEHVPELIRADLNRAKGRTRYG